MNDFVQFVKRVEETSGKKRGRLPVFNANRFYPHSVERSLAALMRSEMERFLAECREAALKGISVADDISELSDVPELPSQELKGGIDSAADAIRRKASQDFADWSEMIVGKPYYPPEAKAEIFDTWKSNFLTLCRSAEMDAKKEMSQTLSTAKNEGWNKARLEKAIGEKLEGKFKARAENIARTETGKLNSAAKLSQFKEVGIEYYRWLTTIDGRERESHKVMNGLICSVSDPDAYFTENPEDPLHPVRHSRTAEMYHGNPGEDFQCRCSMVAWDPEIDGKYEIKSAPEPEEIREPEKTEASAQKNAEAEQAAELEKERLENERLKAELEKARQEAAEREKRLENESKLFKTRFREQINRMSMANRQTRRIERKLERKESAIELLTEENAAFAKKAF